MPAARPPLVVAAVVVAEELVAVALVAAARAAVRLLPARVGAAAGARATARRGVPTVGAREFAGVGPARRRTPLRPRWDSAQAPPVCTAVAVVPASTLQLQGPAQPFHLHHLWLQAPRIYGLHAANSTFNVATSAPGGRRRTGAAARGARAAPGRLGAVCGGPGARVRPRSLRLQIQV